ncbi:MAG: hypothetical protein KDB27_03860 [Planctomycetales bacterium]|nr:hypothetical protein [Planctomycetales bacterium]
MIQSIIVAAAVAAFGQLETSEANDVQDKVDRLVRQLDARDRADRVAAEQSLIDMGPTILPLLPEIDASTSSEKKDRLTRIRSELEKGTAVQSADASTITLSGRMSLGDFLTKVREQTNNNVADFRNRFGEGGDVEIDVDLKDEPFWKAMDSVLDQTGLTVFNSSGELRTVALTSRNPGERDRSGFAEYSGPFRIEATEISTQRNLRSPAIQGMRIRLDVLWEPRLTPLLIRQPYANLKVVTDDGNELASTVPDGSAEIPVQSTVAGVDLVIPFDLPDRSADQIDSLSGTLYALIPGKQVQFEFEKLENARDIAQRQSGVTVTLDRVIKNRDIYEVRIRVKLAQNAAQRQTHLDWASNNIVQLVGKDGKKVDEPNFEPYFEREGEIGYRYLFPLDDEIKNYKLLYKTPASMVEVPVQYELKNIDLP